MARSNSTRLQPVQISPQPGLFPAHVNFDNAPLLREAADRGEFLAAYLVPEAGNPHDAQAVRVDLSDGTRVWKGGYLPRDLAAQWHGHALRLWNRGTVMAGLGVAHRDDPSDWAVELRVRVTAQPLFAGPVWLDRAYAG